MRGNAFKVCLAVSGFALCLGALMLGLKYRTLPYCQVARNGDWYDNKIIRVRATLIFGSGGMYVFEDCDPISALASMVEFEGSTDDGRNYVDEVLVTGERSQVTKAEVIIEGRFNAHFSPGCWRPKYHIAATKIELISAVTYYNPEPVSPPQRMKH